MNYSRHFYCFILLLLRGVFVTAQAPHQPAPFVISADASGNIILHTAPFQYLNDADGKLSVSDVQSTPVANRFQLYNGRLAAPGLKAYWQWYTISNTLNRPVGVVLYETADKAEVYVVRQDKKPERFITGGAVAWSKRDGLKLLQGIPCEIPAASEITVYEKHENELPVDALQVQPGLKDQLTGQPFITDDAFYFGTVRNAAFFGFLLFAALFNFYFFSVVKERVYLFYAITLLSNSLLYGIEPLYHLFFREHPLTLRYLNLLLFLGIYFFFVQAVREFLVVKKYYPRWNKLLIWSSYGYAALLLLEIITGNTYLRLAEIIAYTLRVILFFIMISILVIILLNIRRKEPSARLAILAGTPFIIVWICFNLLHDYFPDYAFWLACFSLVSQAWAVLVLSWSLFDRFKRLLNENAQQALDKERLAREKEEERHQLIEQQKTMLEQQVKERTAELQQSLLHLKQTQSQLLQSEKMASLGELTAGIAHEIQNPLNFVNNFSDLNAELITELKEEIDKGNMDEVKAIADDIEKNEHKINHHGKRADAIIKGMLQHSRASTGKKEPTDINALADEYLRLSYHGLRAKDKSFNADFKTHFDESIGKIALIPQDIGRVLLNLCNNAFYAVNEKKKTADENYKPTVSIHTKKVSNKVEIVVRDNGAGIPQAALDKIYQPFFTTKPTGQGTGLGLSLSYDIITKGHSGTMEAKTEEGQFAEFIITLPVG